MSAPIYNGSKKLYKNLMVQEANKYEQYQCYYTALHKLKQLVTKKFGDNVVKYLFNIKSDDRNGFDLFRRYAEKLKNSLLDEYEFSIFYYLCLIGPYKEKIFDLMKKDENFALEVDRDNVDSLFFKTWRPKSKIKELEKDLNELYKDALDIAKRRFK